MCCPVELQFGALWLSAGSRCRREPVAESEAIGVALCEDQNRRHKQLPLLKMLRASIQCSFALLALSHGIRKHL
jgi:hypothetical protein